MQYQVQSGENGSFGIVLSAGHEKVATDRKHTSIKQKDNHELNRQHINQSDINQQSDLRIENMEENGEIMKNGWMQPKLEIQMTVEPEAHLNQAIHKYFL